MKVFILREDNTWLELEEKDFNERLKALGYYFTEGDTIVKSDDVSIVKREYIIEKQQVL